MALIDEVKTVLNTLASHGWSDLFARHGLDISANDLAAELGRNLPNVDRTIPGFEDFALEGTRGIEPGSPARSIVYHALASPYVHPTGDGMPSDDQEDYPTLEQLDVIENYIFAVTGRRLDDFSNPVVAVVAYQYRAGTRASHMVHADMAYSRTGVSRVGTEDMNYDRRRRSFWPLSASGDGIAVMPARYGIFIAERKRPDDSFVVLNSATRDRFRTFISPIHKLFPGDECLIGETISSDLFEFREFHLNEKLRKAHLASTPGVVSAPPGLRPNEAPYVRHSAELVGVEEVGASCLLVPKTPSDHRLIRIVKQANDVTGQDEIVRFTVPSAAPSNRFWTSFQIPGQSNGRAAPEYLNIRQRVTDPTGTVSSIEDLNQLPEAEFNGILQSGGYEAAHFVDDSCDGTIVVRIATSSGSVERLPFYAAYSLVTAPDFLPLTDQIDIQDWADNRLPTLDSHFTQGGPDPLSNGRQTGRSRINGVSQPGRMPHPDLIDPNNNGQMAFDRNDAVNLTVTAVVSPSPLSNASPAIARRNLAVSQLPDAASNVFAPGWDISQHGDAQGEFYHVYGLGSPFPEDAKLCAALNSFWPAAAPDASRTFGIQNAPTSLPMLDVELGLHPNHPAVQSGNASSHRGWDGEFGPFLETVGGELVVNFANRDRSDYTRSSLDGRVSMAITADVDSEEMIARMEALRDCIRVLPQPSPSADQVSDTALWLVVAERIPNWDSANNPLSGPGYLYEFVLAGGARPADPGDLARLRRVVLNHLVCQISANQIRWNLDGDSFRLENR